MVEVAADPRTRALMDALDGFLEQPPHGIASPILEGIESLSDALKSPQPIADTPGRQAVLDVDSGYAQEVEFIGSKDEVSPGQREAQEVAQNAS